MSIVHWIKTGQRGAPAEFTDSDLLTALILIGNEHIGRYQLQKMLLLSDSSSKSLLNYCKKINLLETTGNIGHSLTSKGINLKKQIDNVILQHGICSYNFFPNMTHYYAIITRPQIDDNQIFSSWKCRDIAVAYGADSIILLLVENNTLRFPEKEMELKDYYPDLENYFHENISISSHSEYYLLIIAASELEIARKSTIITSLHSQYPIIQEIRKNTI